MTFKPTRPGDPLTERQAAIFRYLYEQTRDTGIQPSFRDLMTRFGIRSPHGIKCHLEALEAKGWLGVVAREGRSGVRSRSLKFLRTPSGAKFSGFLDKPPGDEP